MKKNPYTPMSLILPESKQGVASITHFTVDEAASMASCWRAVATGRMDEAVAMGRYARLVVDGELMMTDTQMEKDSNLPFLQAAKGDVLVAGLGLGMILLPVLEKKEVKTVTVLEKYQDVIDLVLPNLPSQKLTVIQADVMNYKTTQMFDTIYFDIWPMRSRQNLEEMDFLHARFQGNLKPNGWMDSWYREQLLQRQREEDKMDRAFRKLQEHPLYSKGVLEELEIQRVMDE